MQRFIPRGLALALVAVLASLVAAAQAAAATFSNPAPIMINDSDTPPTPATPYPSQIMVSGLGTITDVNVTLTGFNHTFPDDVDVLLVGPGGQSVILMSDAGQSDDAVDLTFTFDDEAAALLSEGGALASGSYQPSNFSESPGTFCNDPGQGTDTYAAPAPAGPYGSTLAAFDGANANGTWSLYVVDDCEFQVGSISGGWSLDITGPDPVQMIDDLRDLVAGMGIHHGIANALDAKLRAALAALEADDEASACVAMQDFLNHVSAQSGKKLTEDQAQELTDAANHIREQIGCTA
jgi:subtilisin-like proprotein convertase family protein